VISEAQENGQLPLDDYFDPQSFVGIPGLAGRFPLWLSAEPLIAIRKLAEDGRCLDAVPSYVIGFDEYNAYHGMAWLTIDDHRGVLASTAMHCQRFPVSQCDALHEILVFQIRDLLMDVIDGSEPGRPFAEIDRRIKALTAYVTVACSGGITRAKQSS
jgi:hypothetical protein